MDVVLVQNDTDRTGAGTLGLRLVQFDFSATDPALGLPTNFTFDAGPIIRGFAQQFRDREIGAPGTPRLVSAAFIGANYPNMRHKDPDFMDEGEELFPWNFFMYVLPAAGAGELDVGTVAVTLPMTLGDYFLDVLNVNAEDQQNQGSALSFGFGIAPNNEDPVTTWRPFTNRGTVAELEQGGGHFMDNGMGGFMYVPIPEPATLALLAVGGFVAIRRRWTAA
jgi:hypothetical protein